MFPKNAPSGASRNDFARLCSPVLVAAALLCAASAARAQEKTELLTNLQVEQAYDSNIFLSNLQEKGSAVTLFRPSLTFDSRGTLGWTRLYGFMSEHVYWSESKLTGIDRGFGGDVSRRIFPLTTVFANGSYQRLASHLEIRGAEVVTTTGGSAGVPGETVVQPGQLVEGATPDVDLGQGTFGVKQDLSPRTSMTFSGGPFSIDYLESGSGLNQWRDRWGWYGTVNLDHVLTPLDHVTLELSAYSTDFSDAFSAPVEVEEPGNPHTAQINTGKTKSDQQSLSLGWTHSWT